MSYKTVIGCPDCGTLVKYIAYGSLSSADGYKKYSELREEDLSNMYECPVCEKRFYGNDGKSV